MRFQLSSISLNHKVPVLWPVRSLQDIAAIFNLIPANSFPYNTWFNLNNLHSVNKTEKLDIEKVVFSIQKYKSVLHVNIHGAQTHSF